MKFKICVGYRSYETTEIEVEADDQEQAEEKAIEEAQEMSSSEFTLCDNEWLIAESEEQS